MGKVFCPKSSTAVVKTLVTPILHLWLFYTGWLWLRFRLHFQWACLILSWGIHTGFRLRFSLTSIVTFSKLKSESASVTKPLQWAITFASFLRCDGLFPPTETDYTELFPLVQIRIPVQRVSRMVTVPILGTDLHPYSIHLNRGIRVQIWTSVKTCIVQESVSESESRGGNKP